MRIAPSDFWTDVSDALQLQAQDKSFQPVEAPTPCSLLRSCVLKTELLLAISFNKEPPSKVVGHESPNVRQKVPYLD